MEKLPNEIVKIIKDYLIFKPKNYQELSDAIKSYFSEYKKKYGNISTWDTSLITSMAHLFDGEIGFNLSRKDEFYYFNLDISDWDVSNVTDMSFMFNSCGRFNIDISKWNVSKVTNMDSMFKGCYLSLIHI